MRVNAQDWVGQRPSPMGWRLWWNWELDMDHYADWHAMADKLAANRV
jgi:hypothetical protein